MDFDAWIQQAWADHAGDAEGVAARIEAAGLALPRNDAEVGALARLAHHVHGEHLGDWSGGRDLLQRLAAHPACGDASLPTLRLYQASLALCAGGADSRPGLDPSERIRVSALAAANLAARDAPRATACLQAALADAEAGALPGSDPAARTLAISGNAIAAGLEEKTDRSPAERELMVLGARTARRYWALAGGWLEVERAEYRLAMSWLQAGDLVQARHHARQCLEIVATHQGPALERFFGWEALGRVARAAGDPDGHQAALEQARAAFAALDESDRGWCRASLDGLATASP